MPFKSEAQRRKFRQLVVQGKMKPSVLAEFERDTPKQVKLPERINPKKPDLK